ncbi:four helix bundle protein [Thermodesulfobacteriota bacterium]
MDKTELEKRTKEFALKTVLFVTNLPKSKMADVLGYQLLKSGTSIGANYREANRAESRKDFKHKIAIVAKEAAETQYWLELFSESNSKLQEDNSNSNIINSKSLPELQWLLKESGEILAIFTAGRPIYVRFFLYITQIISNS